MRGSPFANGRSKQSAAAAAWTDDMPVAAFGCIIAYVAFYAELMDACYGAMTEIG